MKRISTKLLSVIAISFIIAIMPIIVFATSEDISIINNITDNNEQEYIIYIKGISKQNFKYAFTNNANPTEMDLSYINSNSDLSGNQVAVLEKTAYEKMSKENKPIFMWAKDEKENLILKNVQLDLTKSLTKEKLDNVETLTKRIEVEIADQQDNTTTIRKEEVNGVKEEAKVGYVKIVDDKKSDYFYEIVKIDDKEEVEKLWNMSQKINSDYKKMNMFDKIQLGAEFNDLYSKVINDANWTEVNKLMIKQPEDSIANNKYVVLLKSENKGDIVTDIQFLTALDDKEEVKEKFVTEETSKLPITGDNPILFVVLVILVAFAVIVVIKMKNNKGENIEKPSTEEPKEDSKEVENNEKEEVKTENEEENK